MEGRVMKLKIRQVNEKDEMIWREMWAEYNAFYGATVPESTTTSTWARIIDPTSSICALVVIDHNVVVGFANYVLHAYTWGQGLACLMDDLFVLPNARGKGAARLLIQSLIDMGHENNWTRVYWMTRQGNTTARSLYDKFCIMDGFIRYTLSLDGVSHVGGNS